ncbi:glycogen operon protein [Faunimonas pinastri]|uniref:Glycogen operon protein n=1 Tax=Faunimonas pinastri TaxID=1855383 RepID=A0A1H9LWJ8_9HYPH|nr:glycogen debranching protein GlgX [Faunimonas pinastri]SER15728.1 glycogen operon protein [Faunimonas pinastri]
MAQTRVEPGSPHPLGATWDGSGVNFALFSANADKVELCLFDPAGRREIARVVLPEHTHEVWHGYLPDVRPGQLYGYRVHGPFDPRNGHRFNPNKLLIDPYAKALQGDLRWHDAHFGYRVGSAREDMSLDRRDSAFVMPKCVVIDPAVTWGDDRRPKTSWADTIIYEAHVKGMTAERPDVPERLRGTFAGFADPRNIDHLVKLGVTTVELMPIQAFFDDRFLVEKGLTNYWGYNTIAYFAPSPRYISPGADLHEFKVLVRRLHEAGIEVILDVVYNHTAEGNRMGPTLSFRGIDNANYYLLGQDRRYYYDTTGCGNTLNLRHPRVLQMVMDSLRYWVENCHVDGFRFDLATSLGREYDSFDPSAVFFDAVQQDPVLSHVKMIAEPWDIGPNGYQVGNFPPGWAEWNGRYRDDMRSFWKGDEGMLPAFAAGALGSSGMFERRGRRAWSSVNFYTAHDGFTLKDQFSYNEKHNAGNKEENRDGHDDNRSWNCGVEGQTRNPEILNLRDRMRRNALATLFFSQGTPMLLMGDENGRTQNGNNNAYCQDSDLAWMEWTKISDRDKALMEFTRGLIALRKTRPLLRQSRFLHACPVDDHGTRDVVWLRPDGLEMQDGDWTNPQSRVLGLLLSGADGERLLILVNSHHDAIPFTLPEQGKVTSWQVLTDTATGTILPEEESLEPGAAFTLEARSLVLLESRVDAARQVDEPRRAAGAAGGRDGQDIPV